MGRSLNVQRCSAGSVVAAASPSAREADLVDGVSEWPLSEVPCYNDGKQQSAVVFKLPVGLGF